MKLKKNTTKKVIKTTLAVAGVVAASVAIFEKFSNMHNKKIRQCFEKNFDDLDTDLENLSESNVKPEHHEKRSHYGTITVNFDDETSHCKCDESITYTPEIKKYDSPNNEKSFKCICNDEAVEDYDTNNFKNTSEDTTTNEEPKETQE